MTGSHEEFTWPLVRAAGMGEAGRLLNAKALRAQPARSELHLEGPGGQGGTVFL